MIQPMITLYKTTIDNDRNHYDIVSKIIQNYLNIKTTVNIVKDKNGKPYCPDLPIHFNISHTKTMLIVAISTKPVGIDIESSSRKIDQRVIERYKQNDASQLEMRHIDYWVMLESAAKYWAQGIQGIKNIVIQKKYDLWYRVMNTALDEIAFCCIFSDKQWTWAVTSSERQNIQVKAWQ